jgi:hypothetical protein
MSANEPVAPVSREEAAQEALRIRTLELSAKRKEETRRLRAMAAAEPASEPEQQVQAPPPQLADAGMLRSSADHLRSSFNMLKRSGEQLCIKYTEEDLRQLGEQAAQAERRAAAAEAEHSGSGRGGGGGGGGGRSRSKRKQQQGSGGQRQPPPPQQQQPSSERRYKPAKADEELAAAIEQVCAD